MLSSIPTASQARKQATQTQSKLCQAKQTEVAEAIQQAIDNLQTSCSIDGILPEALVKDLQAKGYTVKTGGRYNESDTNISW